MRFGPKATLGVAALAGVLALGTSAHAAYLTSFTIDANAKCKSAKIKTSGKGVAAYTGCYAKGASKAVATDPACLSKTSTKNTSAFAKLDLKPPCATTGDGAARDSDSANYAASVDTAVGHGAAGAGKCDAAKQKLIGKYVAGIAGCYAKAAAKAPGTVSNGPGSCTDKLLVKTQAGIAKAELKPPCTTTGNANALISAADTFINGQTCLLAAGTATGCVANACQGGVPNGVLNAGEDCDDTGGVPTQCPAASNTGAGFTCTNCNCACPTKVTFEGDPSDPLSILDTGWTGFGHRAPIISNGAATVTLSCAATSRPCGTCTLGGPIANPSAGAGQLDSRRCVLDTSVHCTSNAQCSGAGNSCEFFFGSLLPLAAGGVTTCVANQFDGPITGIANVETGSGTTTSLLKARVYLGAVIDSPCARCLNDTTINDGVKGGTCDGGARNGLTCDGNGTVFQRPDFGTTSLDCPSTAGALIATLPIDLSSSTAPVTKTLTLASPLCGGDSSQHCLCDTCNSTAAETCDDNSDCNDPTGPIGAICGGKRCVGGTNNGAACNGVLQCSGGANDFAACTVASQCPGGSCTTFCGVVCSGGPNAGNACTVDSECPGVIPASDGCPTRLCGRRGEPSKPSACTDSTTTPDALDCTDQGGGEGECDFGPLTSNCSIASGHAQRGCASDAACGGGPGTCQSGNRKCFLTGDLPGAGGGPDGTGTLVAVGMADLPMNDVSHPTLGAVFCTGVTSADSVNTAAGLPGPGRVTIRGTAVGLP